MSTTNTTTGSNTSTLQYNPIAQGIYNQLTSGAGNVLSGFINSPFSNPSYNLGASQSQKGAQQAGANNMAALQQNMLTSGIGGQAGAGFKQSQLARTGRANQAMSSQANVNNVLAALQRQMSATGTGLSYAPQLTGQTGNFSQMQQTGGLGTWLPQLLGAGLNAGLMGMTGGLSGLGSGAAAAGGVSSALGGLGGIMSPGTWSGITGSAMPGMAGMPGGGLASMLPSFGGGATPFSPFLPGYNFGNQ